MKVQLGAGAVIAIAGVAGAAFVAWRLTRDGGVVDNAKQALASAAEAINPVSPNNLAYRGVNAIGGAIVSDPAGDGKNADGSWTLGGWFYDVTHQSVTEEIKALSGPVKGAEPTYWPEQIDYGNIGQYGA
jgi:hypothetical protein